MPHNGPHSDNHLANRIAELQLLYDVAAITNRVTDIGAAVMYTLRRITEHNCWDWGIGWLHSSDSQDELIPACIWDPEGSSHRTGQSTRLGDIRIRRGEGLVGRVFANGAPELVRQAAESLPIAPREFEQYMATGSVCGFPILIRQRPVGVLEFGVSERMPALTDMSGYMQAVGEQLGYQVERVHTLQVIAQSNERLDLALGASDLGLWDVDLTTSAMVIDQRGANLLGYAPQELEPHASEWESRIHPDDVARVEQARTRYLQEQRDTFEVEYRVKTKSGSWKWIRSRGCVARRTPEGPLRLVGTHQDISQQKKLEREIVETAVSEQRRLGQELHDGLGGDLTGIGFRVQGLIDDLSGRPEAKAAQEIGRDLDRVIEQLRLLSHGLNPVEVDQLGLTVALDRLASRTKQLYHLDCVFRSHGAIHVEDSFVADHLYRIAQEAVTNAVRHANAARILITLEAAEHTVVLKVEDDGVGLDDKDLKAEGIGMRNMQYRAGLIGGSLRIESVLRGGTLVRCDYSSDQL